jgi:5-methylcytosine-specific restriction endonuclease McrA
MVKPKRREWLAKNAEKMREYYRRYRLDHIEKERIRSKERYANDKEAMDKRLGLNLAKKILEKKVMKSIQLSSKYKTCPGCKKTKIKSLFPRLSHCKDGLYTYCRSCKSIMDKRYNGDHMDRKRQVHKAYYSKFVSRIKEKTAKWKSTNPDRVKANHQRRRARKRNVLVGRMSGVQWTNLKQAFLYMCPLCRQSEPEIRLTMDHVIPLALGGSHDQYNIQPLCFSCNSRKNMKVFDFRSGFMAHRSPLNSEIL